MKHATSCGRRIAKSQLRHMKWEDVSWQAKAKPAKTKLKAATCHRGKVEVFT